MMTFITRRGESLEVTKEDGKATRMEGPCQLREAVAWACLPFPVLLSLHMALGSRWQRIQPYGAWFLQLCQVGVQIAVIFRWDWESSLRIDKSISRSFWKQGWVCGGVQGGCAVGQGLGECGDGGSELDDRARAGWA